MSRAVTHALYGEGGVAPDADVLTRATANTTTADVLGLLGAQSLPAEVLRRVAKSQRDNLGLIAAMTTASLTTGQGLPWVPDLPPPQPAQPQTGEKQQLWSRTITVEGGTVVPDLIGITVNLAAQVSLAGGRDAVLAIAARDVVAGVAEWIVDHLTTAAGAAVANVSDALAAVEAAGWSPDLVVVSRSEFNRLVPGASPAAYPDVVHGPTGARLFVVALGGITCALVPEEQLIASEPNIGGEELSVIREGVLQASAGSVAVVGGGA